MLTQRKSGDEIAFTVATVLLCQIARGVTYINYQRRLNPDVYELIAFFSNSNLFVFILLYGMFMLKIHMWNKPIHKSVILSEEQCGLFV
jgi:hypothetical protein